VAPTILYRLVELLICEVGYEVLEVGL